MSTNTKLDRMMTYLEGLLRINSHDHLVTRSCEICGKPKPLYLYYHNFMVTKLGRVVTYPEGLPSIKSHDLLVVKGSCEITWQIKTIISPLHFTVTCRGGGPFLKVIWTFDHVTNVRSCDKSKQLYLSQDLRLPNLVGCWLRGGGSEHKRLSRHRLLVS